MRKLWFTLGFIWLLPATLLVWLLYVLPLWALGYIKLDSIKWPVVEFKLKAVGNWYAKLWKKWWGWSGPCVYIYEDTDYIILNDGVEEQHRAWLNVQAKVTETHEVRHCLQQLIFGPLHYPLYGLSSLVLWIYGTVANKDIHSYYDNPFERDARKNAGQPVHIPRSQWSDGPNDRNPWG